MKSNLSKFIHCNHYNSPLPFQFSVYGNDAYTQKFKTLKGCFNTFQLVDKALSFSHSLILLSFAQSKQRISERKFQGIPALMARSEEGFCFKPI